MKNEKNILIEIIYKNYLRDSRSGKISIEFIKSYGKILNKRGTLVKHDSPALFNYGNWLIYERKVMVNLKCRYLFMRGKDFRCLVKRKVLIDCDKDCKEMILSKAWKDILFEENNIEDKDVEEV